MGIFNWKKKPESASATAGAAGSGAAGTAGGASDAQGAGVAAKPESGPKGAGAADSPAFSPEKARVFFERAQAMHDATNFEYAMNLWLSGLRLDPGSMTGVEGFFRSAASWLSLNKKSLDKETVRSFSGKSALDRYLSMLLERGTQPLDVGIAVEAAEAAAAMGLREPAAFLAQSAYGLVSREKKPRKDHFVKIMEAAQKAENWNVAVASGEAAVRLDPTDGRMSDVVRNLAAQQAMSKGGFDQTGQAGGFRQNIRDAAKQRQNEDEGRIVKSEETLDRLVDLAKTEYESNPTDRAGIKKYASRLLERARPADEEEAVRVLERAYEDLKEYFFRQTVGEVRIRQVRRRMRELTEKLAASPGDAGLTAQLEKSKARLSEIELEEYLARAAAYPTDLGVKLELGKRFYQAGRHEEAIAQFQQSQADPRNRLASLNALGLCFQAIGWHEEAVGTFRQALENAGDASEQVKMELQYGLLVSLQSSGTESSDMAQLEEALKLASAIAMQQMTFRDVRARRDAIKAVIQEKRQTGKDA